MTSFHPMYTHLKKTARLADIAVPEDTKVKEKEQKKVERRKKKVPVPESVTGTQEALVVVGTLARSNSKKPGEKPEESWESIQHRFFDSSK